MASADAQLGLAAGLALALRQLRLHAGEGARWNARALRSDRVFLALLGVSVAGFLRVAAAEGSELSRERKAAAKAEKVKAARSASVASMLHLDVAAATPVARPRKAKPKVSDAFWSELRFVLSLAFPRGLWSKGGALLGTQFGLLVARTLLSVKATKVSTYVLTRAISQKSWPYWAKWVTNFVAWMTAATTVNSGLRYTESLLAAEVRSALTRAAHAKYCAGDAFYRTSVLREGALDHVDQRICSDIAAFSREAAAIYGHSFKPILEFVLTLSESATALGYSRPIALFASQIVVTGLLRSMTPPLGRMVAKEAELEGSFRAAHSRLIAHAEEVAFLRGGDTERGILNSRLSVLISTQRWHALQRIRKSVSDNIGKFQGLLFGAAFVHIPFLASTLRQGEGERISAFRATEELMLRCGSSFVEILQLGKSIDELAGHTQRIKELFVSLEPAPAASAATRAQPGATIAFYGVSVSAPEPGGKQRLLVKDLDLELSHGQSLIVTGPNGAGKTSLLRVLAGLWPPTAGRVVCPPNLFWLPQRPYLATGTLRDQVTYPHQVGFQRRFDERIKESLLKAGLERLAETPAGLDREHPEWGDVLSGGERQRIGFARLFYATPAPAYAVLDEATSAINADGEKALYEALSAAGIGIVSVAHRMELRRFHKQELRLAGDGSGAWSLEPLA